MRYMMPIVVLLFLIACMGSPTEPLAASPTPVTTSVPTTVSPIPPRLSIVGGCDTWGPWTPKWVVTNSGGPTASINDYWNKDGWVYYSVSMVGFPSPQLTNSFNMEANSSTNIGSFLYGTFNPHYILRIVYKPTGTDISNTVDCSAGVPTPTPVGTPYPTPTPTPRPTPTPTPGNSPTPCPPGPGGGCQ